MIREVEQNIKEIEEQLIELEKSEKGTDKLIAQKLRKKKEALMKDAYKTLTASDRVYIARHNKRPNSKDFIDALFTNFLEQRGDRLSDDDRSIIGGIAKFHDKPVTVIGHLKGKTLDENIKYNFGMPNPSGYRKVQRLARQAEKFNRPIITFIDTPGAFPGIEAEKNGQGEAIAQCLALFSSLNVPVIAIIIGEGGSGGALALGVANTIIMLENSVYSILSPEGFASILWKDASRKDEACEYLKLTALDLKKLGVCDYIVSEGVGNLIENEEKVMKSLDKIIDTQLSKLLKISKLNKNAIKQMRYEKFRVMGKVCEIQEESQ
ncbi:MAG: acetyl-CoA carboxylase carboxyltransferase subunit alpha [Clostridia bacterium]